MAITDPTAIGFSNEQIRPLADKLAQIYTQCKTIVNVWNAQSMGTVITNTSDIIEDGSGSGSDTRNQITGADATNIITRAQEFITDYEEFTNAKLNTVLKVAVNP